MDLMTMPMRRELTRLGASELRTPDEVDAFMTEAGDGTTLLIVNSTCGCAAGSMRPAVAMALEKAASPTRIGTVFAGQDADATARARDYIVGYPPSSPSVALFREGELVFMLERHRIQGRTPQEIAAELAQALDAFGV